MRPVVRPVIRPPEAPVRRRSRSGPLVAMVCWLLPALIGPGSHAADPEMRWRGRPLIEVLEQLRSGGLKLVFSTAVVTPDLIVTVEPRAPEARLILDEILAPLALTARDGPGGSLLIVPSPGASDTAIVRGRVLSATSGAPVVGALVRVTGCDAEGATRPDGTFRIAGVPSGIHGLTAHAAGFMDRTLAAVEVSPDATREVVVALQPWPGYVEEIVVTPSRHSLVRDDPAARQRIDHQDAELVPILGGDVVRVIESLPGVAAADNSSAFNLRGSEVRDVSLILDGLELYDPFHLQELQSPFSLIDTEMVETIDVLGGGFTAEFGDRRGGFVELSTALPEGSDRARLELGTLNSGFSYGAPTAAGSLLVSGRAWYPEALWTTLEVGEPGLDPRFGDVYVKSSFVVSPRTALSLHGLLASDRLAFREVDGNEQVDVTDRSAHVWLRALQSWAPSVFSDTVVSAGRLERSRRGRSEPGDEVIAVEDDRTVDFFGVKSDLTWEVTGSQLLKFGFLLRPLRAAYRYASGPAADPATGTSTRLDPSGTSFGAYAAHRIAFSERFATELGVRWDRQTYTDDNQVSPRLNALWHAGDRTDLRVGLGRFYQSQRIHELDVEDGATGYSPAELSRQVDLTLQHRSESGLRFRLDGYYGAITRPRPRHENLFNPIELFPETSPDRVSIAPEHARLRGAEIFFGADPARPFYWWGSYTWSSAEDVVDGQSEPRSWDQTHAGRLFAAWRRSDRWTMSLLATVRSGWPTTPVTGVPTIQPDGSTEIVATPGARNSERFPLYARLDARASRTFPLARGRLRLEVEVANLTDRNNVCCVDEFLFTTFADGSVGTVTELDYWLGLTPSFSLLWMF